MRITRRKILLLLAVLTLGALIISGCTRTTGMARGWSGGLVVGDNLFIASMEGRVIAMDAADGTILGEPVAVETAPASGGLGCGSIFGKPTATAVAIYGSPAVSGDLVYVGGYDGKIYALMFDEDGLRSEPRWIYPRQGSIGAPIVGGIVVADDKLYFGSADGKVYALDAADGFREWLFETGSKIWSTPAIAGETLFIGSFDKKLYAIDSTTGKERWEKPFEVEGAIVSTPVVYNNIVYFGSFDRHFYAVDVVSGEEVWRFPTGEDEEGNPSNWFWVKPVAYDGVIYAASLDGKVYALNADNGEKIAEFDLGSPISSSPVLVGSSIILVTQKGDVYSLDTTNKQQKLLDNLEETVHAPLFAGDGVVYVHTISDALYALDVQSGASKKFSLKSSE